jgi:hypothetical protein
LLYVEDAEKSLQLLQRHKGSKQSMPQHQQCNAGDRADLQSRASGCLFARSLRQCERAALPTRLRRGDPRILVLNPCRNHVEITSSDAIGKPVTLGNLKDARKRPLAMHLAS